MRYEGIEDECKVSTVLNNFLKLICIYHINILFLYADPTKTVGEDYNFIHN